jgi:hypothetical protein
MRMLLKVTLPVEAANNAVKSGTMPKLMEQFMADLKPEASYFLPENGKRTMFIFFDLKDPSQIPEIVEPLFMELNAAVELTPAMSADDLRKGLQAANAKYGRRA